jgi:hypothetical protein
MDEIGAIQICLPEDATADDLSLLIEPLTAYNECNNDCGRPSELVQEEEEETFTLEDAGQPTEEQYAGQFLLLNLYPNPSTGILNIEFDMDFEREVRIRILDINGQEQRVEEIESIIGRNSVQMDISLLSPGTYLVQVIDGQLVRSKRFLRVQ